MQAIASALIAAGVAAGAEWIARRYVTPIRARLAQHPAFQNLPFAAALAAAPGPVAAGGLALVLSPASPQAGSWIAAAIGLCVSISYIDIRRGVVPFRLAFMLFGTGVAYRLFFAFDAAEKLTPSVSAAATAAMKDTAGTLLANIALAALMTWLFSASARVTSSSNGIGFGDTVLLAAAAAWLPSYEYVGIMAAIAILSHNVPARIVHPRLQALGVRPFAPGIGIALVACLVMIPYLPSWLL